MNSDASDVIEIFKLKGSALLEPHLFKAMDFQKRFRMQATTSETAIHELGGPSVLSMGNEQDYK